MRHGIALITEDRKAQGLALNQSLLDNALAWSAPCSPAAPRPCAATSRGSFTRLEVVARDLDQEVQFLSGGNQQKVVLAKWLASSRGC